MSPLADWRVLLTRPAEDCQVLAQTLAQMNVYASCLPLLAMESLPATAEQEQVLSQLERYSAILVVSKPAARFALQRLTQMGLPLPLQPRWFTVGSASAAVLREAGLEVHHPAQGDDSEALLALPAFQQCLASANSSLLIIRADQGRDWLAQHLRGRGVRVDYLALYRRYLPAYAPGSLWQQVQREQLNGLVVSSGQGFVHLQQLAADDWSELAKLALFVPSERVAHLAKEAGAQYVINCRGASATALQAALRSAQLPRLDKRITP